MENVGLDVDLSDLPFSLYFTWNGETYSGCIGDLMDNKSLEAGGYALTMGQELVCATNQFLTSWPEPEQTISTAFGEMRIESVTTSPCRTFLVLRLKNISRGA